MSQRRVAVIVLNWNGWSDSLACLDSLRQAVGEGFARVLIVDNSSTDDSVPKIRQWLQSSHFDFMEVTGSEPVLDGSPSGNVPEYVLIQAPRNLGYAGGNNLGIKFALRQPDTEYVFVLNNDTVVEPQCISRLLAFADQDPTIGIAGSTLIEEEGCLRIAGGAKYNRLLTTTKPAIARDGARDPHIDYVSGAAMFIRATTLRQVGLLSEDYFLYFEELDFTHRVTMNGLKIKWCPQSVVYHAGGRSAGSRSKVNKKKSTLSEYHSNLSCLIYTHKFHPRLFWLAALLRFLLKLVHDVVHMQPGLVVPLVHAYRDYIVRARQLKT